MPKNSWSSWQEAVKSLLEALGKQRVHQMTEGSNVGGVGGTDGADRQEEGDAEDDDDHDDDDDDVFYLFLQKQNLGAKLHIYL